MEQSLLKKGKSNRGSMVSDAQNHIKSSFFLPQELHNIAPGEGIKDNNEPDG